MKVEPAADLRAFATVVHQLYVALTEEGFTESQALIVVGVVVSSQLGGESD